MNHASNTIEIALASRKSAVPAGEVVEQDCDIMHLGEMTNWLRQRFGIDESLSDDGILASLRAIVGQSERRARWRAAFDSELGTWLAHRGTDLNTALNTILAVLPNARC